MRDMIERHTAPAKQGLYDPRFEHDSCGVGFVVNLQGRKSHSIVQKAIEVLINLEHRGACGCEKNTGDGAGISVQTPHTFFVAECATLKISLPGFGDYGVGMIFLPTETSDREQVEQLFEGIVRDEGQTVLGWRNVPTDDSAIGPTAKGSEPVVRQIFIGRKQ